MPQLEQLTVRAFFILVLAERRTCLTAIPEHRSGERCECAEDLTTDRNAGMRVG